jgi:hypothetical protein
MDVTELPSVEWSNEELPVVALEELIVKAALVLVVYLYESYLVQPAMKVFLVRVISRQLECVLARTSKNLML